MFAGCNLLCYLEPGRLAPAPLKPTQVPSPKPEGRQQEASLSSAPYYPAMFANWRKNEGQFLINGPRQNACAGRLPAALRPGVRLLGHEPGPDPGPRAGNNPHAFHQRHGKGWSHCSKTVRRANLSLEGRQKTGSDLSGVRIYAENTKEATE